MKRSHSLLYILCLFAFSAYSQQRSPSTYSGFPSLVWPKLYDIRFEKAKDTFGEYEKPVFSQETKALDGKAVTLPGYMVPFENGSKGKVFMLTSLPLNACFFCGVGGPESVVEVYLKETVTYTEKPIEIKGVLRLNATDPDKMIYRIEQAEFLGEIDF